MALYCGNCGKMLNEDARFCSSCGRAVANPSATASAYESGLVRPRAGRKLAGVCQGLANRLGWDVTLLRIIFAILAVLTFPIGILLYLIFWMIMPKEVLPPLPPMQTSGQTGT